MNKQEVIKELIKEGKEFKSQDSDEKSENINRIISWAEKSAFKTKYLFPDKLVAIRGDVSYETLDTDIDNILWRLDFIYQLNRDEKSQESAQYYREARIDDALEEKLDKIIPPRVNMRIFTSRYFWVQVTLVVATFAFMAGGVFTVADISFDFKRAAADIQDNVKIKGKMVEENLTKVILNAERQSTALKNLHKEAEELPERTEKLIKQNEITLEKHKDRINNLIENDFDKIRKSIIAETVIKLVEGSKQDAIDLLNKRLESLPDMLQQTITDDISKMTNIATNLGALEEQIEQARKLQEDYSKYQITINKEREIHAEDIKQLKRTIKGINEAVDKFDVEKLKAFSKIISPQLDRAVIILYIFVGLGVLMLIINILVTKRYIRNKIKGT